MTSQVFVSYSRDDGEFVRRLVDDLTSRGVDIWLDVRDILASERWDSEVQAALRESDFFMVVLSPTSSGSENVQDEIAYALSKKKRVFPILYRDCDVPFRLARIQYVDFREEYEAGLDRLVEQMRTFGVPISGEAPQPAPEGEPPGSEGAGRQPSGTPPGDQGGGGKSGLASIPVWGWAVGAAVLLVVLVLLLVDGGGDAPDVTAQVSPGITLAATDTPRKDGVLVTITPVDTPVLEEPTTPSFTPEELPTQTFTPSPTPDRFTSQGDCVAFAPPCDYTVVSLDSFVKIAIKIYGGEDLTPLLMNANRDEQGYRIKLNPGDVIPIPDAELTISDLAKRQYPRCGPNVFPCWYEAKEGDSYDRLATIFYANPAAVKPIQSANWAYDADQPTRIVTPEITPGLLLVLPVVAAP